MIPVGSGGIEIDPNAPLTQTMLFLVFLFACSFFFSGTETALFSLQAIDRQQLGTQGRTGEMVVRLLGRRAATLTTILIGNEFANTALAATTAALAIRFFPHLPGLNVVVLTPVLVLVSEITPKYAAIRTNRAWSLASAWPLAAFAIAVTPLRVVFTQLVILGARLFRADPVTITEGLEESELMVLVDRGAAAGALDESEREIIGNIFELEDLTLDRVMTPRPDMFHVPIDIGWDDLMERCRTAGHSRVPVTEPGTGEIKGVLLVKDLLRLRDRPRRRSGPRWLAAHLMPAVFMPSSKPSDAMFREFLQRKYHMAFVVDEHGTLVGLVTLDDLVIELLGEDDHTEDSEVAQLRPDTLKVRAHIDLEDFLEETGIELPEGEYHTLGGYVFHLFGRLPKVGDRVDEDAYSFVVTEMDGRRIVEVEVIRRPVQEAM